MGYPASLPIATLNVDPGVSTREVAAVMEEIGGIEVSLQTVSQAAAQLDEAVKRWREPELEGASYPRNIAGNCTRPTCWSD